MPSKRLRSTEPYTVTAMPEAGPSADASKASVSLQTESNSLIKLSIPANVLAEMVARLIGVHGEMNKKATRGLGGMSMLVGGYEVAGDRRQRLVLLRLSPAPDAPFEFGLSPEAAEKIGQALVGAAAILRSSPPQQSH